MGSGLLVLSLLFDGILALKEKLINHEVKHNKKYISYESTRLSWDYMFIFNFYALIFSIFALGKQFKFTFISLFISIY